MGQAFGGGQAAIDVAVAALPLLMVVGSALYLRGQLTRYGRLAGWPGQLTLAALLTGLGLVAYAVWPLPASVDGVCPVIPEPTPPLDVRSILLAFGVFLPVGILARARFRRGLPVTLALGTALALAVTAVRATGVLGFYPCAYNTGPLALAGVAVAGVLLGWLAARWAPLFWPLGPHRSWPGAVPDRGVPDLTRRVLGTLLDLGLWWFGSALTVALLHAYGVIGSGVEDEVRTALLFGLALVFGLFLPLMRRDRATLGTAAVRVALADRTVPRAAPRHRVLLRSLLLQAPVVVLIALGLGWWSLIVVALHASTAVVRPDGTGLADLVCGTRVRTRATLDGGLPERLVRYAPPAEEPPRTDREPTHV
ncbi:RDD family protein [Nocardiopsis sp. MG754419]|uniref:RDD family protein n=1 Tax=Nocardiopsis sp. MG754419 TaxID=2259865 RepID=UPI001BAC37EC|nr:RDD family protein [Nocardiopsis sp. MG754419]MBR8743633.1 antibiotic resistance protein VanZ [Nocardiopsis sp. MG754419]